MECISIENLAYYTDTARMDSLPFQSAGGLAKGRNTMQNAECLALSVTGVLRRALVHKHSQTPRKTSAD